MLCEWRSLQTSDRDDHSKTSYCHLILGSTDIYSGPTLAKFSVKLVQFSLAETAQYVTQCSWCCMQGISLLITSATTWSPIYPNLWKGLLNDSGLFIFLTQVLIWSYSVSLPSQLDWVWIQDKELHTHTLLYNILTVFCSFRALQSAWPFCAGSCLTHDTSDPFW